MCFSAGASFGASALLATTSVFTLNKTRDFAQKPFASIPLLFSIQQLSEGFIWLGLTNSDYCYFQNISLYIYLVFAQVIWPTWVPLSIWIIEKEEAKKRILFIIFLIGMAVSSYLAYCLISYPVEAQIANRHIEYALFFPNELILITGILYIIATVLPPFLSNIKYMQLLGTISFITCITTIIFYHENFISVWCFFAAVISAVVFYIIEEHNKDLVKEIKPIHTTQNV